MWRWGDRPAGWLSCAIRPVRIRHLASGSCGFARWSCGSAVALGAGFALGTGGSLFALRSGRPRFSLRSCRSRFTLTTGGTLFALRSGWAGFTLRPGGASVTLGSSGPGHTLWAYRTRCSPRSCRTRLASGSGLLFHLIDFVGQGINLVFQSVELPAHGGFVRAPCQRDQSHGYPNWAHSHLLHSCWWSFKE